MRCLLIFLLVLSSLSQFTGSIAFAQQSPKIAYIYPAGGKRNSTNIITIAGQFLDGATNVIFSGKGLTSSIIKFTKPLSAMEQNALREELKLLEEKRITSAAQSKNIEPVTTTNQLKQSTNTTIFTLQDKARLAQIRQLLADSNRRRAVPAMSETIQIMLVIDENAEPIEQELRIQTRVGISNPMKFIIGDLPEFVEPVSELPPTPAEINQMLSLPARSPYKLDLPVTINGQLLPGEIDKFTFKAAKGEKLVFYVNSRKLIPYIADAVPGWCQTILKLYNSENKELISVDDWRFDPDPVMFFDVPENGSYTLTINDALFRGRSDFVYRITAGTLPFITNIFPPGCSVGATNKINIYGWNIPDPNFDISDNAKTAGLKYIHTETNKFKSNFFPFFVADIKDCTEAEPNNDLQSAMKIFPPIIINGRINYPGDVDIFKFECLSNKTVAIEVQARRLASPLDSIITVMDGSGKTISINDDYLDPSEGLLTHYADSYLMFTAASNGTYYVKIQDVQNHGGNEFTYRLRISQPSPDFELRIAPSSVTSRAGGTVPLKIYAFRKDGFTDQIQINLINPEQGFILNGGLIPEGQSQITATLTFPPQLIQEPIFLEFEGSARINGTIIKHKVTPADEVEQAFSYHHLLPAQNFIAFVNQIQRPVVPIKPINSAPVVLSPQTPTKLRFAVPPILARQSLTLELLEPKTNNIHILSHSISNNILEVLLKYEPTEPKHLISDNIIIEISSSPVSKTQRKPSQANQSKNKLGVLPAVPFIVQ